MTDEPEAELSETRPCRMCNESGMGKDFRACQFCKGEGFLVVTLDDLERGPDDDEGDWWENDDAC